jgi:galactokinase
LNTGVKRALASSAYNERRAECDEALKKLVQNGVEARSLRDISAKQLLAFEHTMSDVIRRRAQHVINENQRVVGAVAALKSGNLEELGRLMIASHWSLTEDFAVSCEELNYLVESLSQSDSVLGARMTGAGFGGCAVALVAQDSLEAITEQITSSYHQRFGLALTTMAPIGNLSAGIVLAA